MTKIIKVSGELEPELRCNYIQELPQEPLLVHRRFDQPAENIYIRHMTSPVRMIGVPEPEPYEGSKYLKYCAGDAETELIFRSFENTINERDNRIEILSSKINKLESELVQHEYTLDNIYHLTFWERIKFAATGKL